MKHTIIVFIFSLFLTSCIFKESVSYKPEKDCIETSYLGPVIDTKEYFL